MPPRTHTEKIDELYRMVTALDERVNGLTKRVEDLATEAKETRKAVEGMTARMPVVERELENVKKSNDEWGRRTWAVLLALVSAIIGGAITYLLKR